MKDFASLPLRVVDNVLEILDQRRLPDDEVWLRCRHPRDMVAFIRQLSVRGAPLIGVAAALALALHAEGGAGREDVLAQADALHAARPTAVNLMWAVDRMKAAADGGTAQLAATAEAIAAEDVAMCARIAANGAALIADGERIVHHCNTGALATVGCGTALGVIAEAWRQGKRIHVYVDETRPLLQGARLTAWELRRLGVPYTLICDSMAAALMRDGRIDRVILGADRIAANGDFANKVGTYNLAVLARHHGIPFHSVAPTSTVDAACPGGPAIAIEMRGADEVRGFGATRWAPADAPVHNPSFDWTPAALVTSFVLDTGVVAGPEYAFH